MIPPAQPEPFRARGSVLGVGIAVACATMLAVQDTASSRMLVWPWQLLYWLGPLAVGLALLLQRAGAAEARLSRAWTAALALAAGGLLWSTWHSPFRAQVLPWCAWPLTLIALAAVSGGLFACPQWGARRARLALVALGVAGAVLTLTSLTMWLASLAPDFGRALASRNSHPLGHANYTAGTAVLFLPVLGGLAWLGRGWRRAGWALAAAACLAMLFSSGSRGGLVGLAALTAPALLVAWRRLPRWCVVACAALVLGLGLLHPSVRRGLLPPSPDAPINMSNAQRTAWIEAGWMAVADRPLSGWGTGATPWMMPRYRGELDYGPYEVLQLHNTPLQLWAEGGLPTVLALLLLAGLVIVAAVRLARTDTMARADAPVWVAISALAGYGAFALTDWQLDLPVVCVVAGLLLGLVAARSAVTARGTDPAVVRLGGLTVIAVLLAGAGWVAVEQLRLRAALERGDWPAALALAPRDAAVRVYAADRLLRTSEGAPKAAEARRREALQLLDANTTGGLIPELSHCLAGWTRLQAGEAATALVDFDAAVRVAPNHHSALLGGALAAAALGQREAGVARLTRACVARPRFLASGWWRVERLAVLRAEVLGEVDRALAQIASDPAVRVSMRREAEYVRALAAWIEDDDAASGLLIARAPTSDLRRFWAELTGAVSEEVSAGGATEGVPVGLRSILRLRAEPGDVAWMELIRARLGESISLQTERALVENGELVGLVRGALRPGLDSPWPYYQRRGARAGFQVNHRHPRLDGISDGGLHSDTLWADVLLAGLWPEEFWLSDALLPALEEPCTP